MRLGRTPADGNKSRPIKATLTQKSLRNPILKDAPKLKDKGVAYKRIYIKKDTHPAFRKEYDRIHKSVKTEQEKAENRGKVVVYDHENRVVTVDGIVVDRYNPNFF